VVHILLAILGISFLIFIHELGHYWMARRVGMKVETFSIGFGRPIFVRQWQGVKWQVGWLPFGGYVKIAGTDLESNKDPYKVSDGFFGKTPWQRIKVALAGPLVNLLFALLVFALLWVVGGREKRFGEFTQKLGWVDPKSHLYMLGVRPGDEVISYDHQPLRSAKDHIYRPLTGEPTISLQGNKVNYTTGERTPFDVQVDSYSHPESMDPGILTSGVLESASYLIYQPVTAPSSPVKNSAGKENQTQKAADEQYGAAASGIQPNDRLVWVDGHRLFSVKQLQNLLSDHRALVTVKRGDTTFLARVPRVPVHEIRPNAGFKEELTDWQFEAGLEGTKWGNLWTLPYDLTNNAVVKGPLHLIDAEKDHELWSEMVDSSLEAPLQAGDQIVAVYGNPVRAGYDLLKELQEQRVLVIVQRLSFRPKMDSTQEDHVFDQSIASADLEKIASGVGLPGGVQADGDLVLLRPIAPKTRLELAANEQERDQIKQELQQQRQVVDSLSSAEQREKLLAYLEKLETMQVLGLKGIQDQKVVYNPGPFALFWSVADEIKSTLGSLFSGALNPKWLSGPVGMVQIVQQSAMQGLREVLYWLGAISLNLGLLNLLPIPVLDGGSILISLLEIATGRKIHPKTLEKIIIPFAILLILFFLFLTYNDLLRVF